MEVSTDGPDQTEHNEGRKSAPLLIESPEEAGKQKCNLGQAEGLEEEKHVPGCW